MALELAKEIKTDEENGLTQWAVSVYDNNAYWVDREPKPEVVVKLTFNDELQALIKAKIIDKTILGANVEVVDIQNETAVVRVWIDGTQVGERRIFVNKVSDKLQIKFIGS